MGVRVNARMSRIVPTPISVGVRTYAAYANCRTLGFTQPPPHPITPTPFPETKH